MVTSLYVARLEAGSSYSSPSSWNSQQWSLSHDLHLYHVSGLTKNFNIILLGEKNSLVSRQEAVEKKQLPEPGVMVHACNPSTQEAEAGESPIQGQPGLQSKTLSQTKQNKNQKKKRKKKEKEIKQLPEKLLEIPRNRKQSKDCSFCPSKCGKRQP
jgi:hypothetical protein